MLDVQALVGGGTGMAGGILLGLAMARKYFGVNGHVGPICPGAETFAEVKASNILLREAVDRNTEVSKDATAALLATVQALVKSQRGTP